MREGALDRHRAAARLAEILHVAVSARDEVVGVSSVRVRRNEQLRMDLWHYRTFVAVEHRRGNLGYDLFVRAREHLERQFVEGTDRRASGLELVVQHDGLKRHQPHGHWRRGGVWFIGEDARGAWIRVRFFPGAVAPLPAGRSA